MIKFSKSVFFLLLPLFAYSDDISVLLNTKQEIIQLKQNQINQKEKVNKYDWVSDIELNASISTDEENRRTNDYKLSLSQEIFNFGGISSEIDYAKELKKMEDLALNMDEKDDLNMLFSLLIDVKIDVLKLEQNLRSIYNSEISIRNKKSEYKAGELDISDLNDAIMTKNELSDTRKALELSKLININTIKKYTDKKYETINLPNIKMMTKDAYLENANLVNYAKLDIGVNNSLYKIKKSDYLPSLSITGTYGYNDTTITNGDDYYNYGLKLSMPLSLTSSSDIEQTKIDYLISKKELADELISSESTYDEGLLIIKNYKDRIVLALQDIKLYDELLEVNEEEYKAGYKTLDDVETLQNSKRIRTVDVEIYKLNIQKQILNLYFNINN